MRESRTSGGSGPSWSGRPDGGMSDRASAWARVAGRPGQMSRAHRVVRTGGVGRAVESPEMPDPLLSRRVFLADLGRGAAAVAVLGLAGNALAACSPTNPSPTAAPSGQPTTAPPSADPGSPSAGSSTPPGSASSGGPLVPGGVAWRRVDLGFVSAYLLIRDGEGAIVDTGVAGSEDEIYAA